MISAIVLAAGEIVVVLGAHAEAIRKQVRCDREQLILNPEYADGISTSIQAGLRAISGEAALIVLADQPFVRPETIDLRSKIVIPTYNGTRGNPVLVDRSLFAEIMELRGDVGYRSSTITPLRLRTWPSTIAE